MQHYCSSCRFIIFPYHMPNENSSGTQRRFAKVGRCSMKKEACCTTHSKTSLTSTCCFIWAMLSVWHIQCSCQRLEQYLAPAQLEQVVSLFTRPVAQIKRWKRSEHCEGSKESRSGEFQSIERRRRTVWCGGFGEIRQDTATFQTPLSPIRLWVGGHPSRRRYFLVVCLLGSCSRISD